MNDTTIYDPDIQWVFFDCFNTILLEPEAQCPYPYLIPIADLAVRHGLYISEEEFVADYGAWYKRRWPARLDNEKNSRWREMPLAERLSNLFHARLFNLHKYRSTEESMVKCDGAPAGTEPEKKTISLLITEMITLLTNHYLRELVPSDRVVNMLDHLAGKVRLAVISNYYIAGWPALALDYFGLGAYFDFVIDSAAFGTKKPGIEIYEEALRRAEASSEEVIFIGDSWDNDILIPHSLGMHTLYVQFTSMPRPTTTLAYGYQVPSISHWDDLIARWG